MYGTKAFGFSLIVLGFCLSCSQRAPSSGFSNLDGFPNDPTNLQGQNPNWPQQLDDAFAQSAGSSQASGGLTQADQTALMNMAQETGAVEPIDDEMPLEVQQALQQWAQNPNMEPAQRMAIAQQVMAACGKSLAGLGPVPGQTLMGQWTGKTCTVYLDKKGRPIDPTRPDASGKMPVAKTTIPGKAFGLNVVQGPQSSQNFVYGVNGSAQGAMQVTGAFDGGVVANPWQGLLMDANKAGRIKNAQFNQTKFGWQTCDMGVNLTASRNPIPENYVEAMRRSGKCYRQALILFNPMMDRLFENMDPRLATVLKLRMLGVQ